MAVFDKNTTAPELGHGWKLDYGASLTFTGRASNVVQALRGSGTRQRPGLEGNPTRVMTPDLCAFMREPTFFRGRCDGWDG